MECEKQRVGEAQGFMFGSAIPELEVVDNPGEHYIVMDNVHEGGCAELSDWGGPSSALTDAEGDILA